MLLKRLERRFNLLREHNEGYARLLLDLLWELLERLYKDLEGFIHNLLLKIL